MKRSMKLRFYCTICVSIVSIWGISNTNSNFPKNQVESFLQIENVEALASNEGVAKYCVGSGSVDCNGYKAEIVYTLFNLPLKYK